MCYIQFTMNDQNKQHPRFLDAVSLSQTKKPDQWVLSNLLATGTEMHLFGEEGGGKSRVAWQLAHAVATGNSWLSVFEIHQTGKVMFIECDMDRSEVDLLLDDVNAADLNHPDIILPEERPDIDILTFDNDCSYLVEAYNEIKPVLVVIDTVNESGVEENTNKETTHYLRRIRRMFPDAARLILNHEKKKGTSQDGAVLPSNQQSYLGGAWPRKTRTTMQLVTTKNDQGNPYTARLRITKQRGRPVINKVELTQCQVTGFWKPKMDIPLALTHFPYCIPVSNGRSSECRTMADVCRAIGETFDWRPDTVRQAYDRAIKSGVEYPWAENLHSGI